MVGKSQGVRNKGLDWCQNHACDVAAVGRAVTVNWLCAAGKGEEDNAADPLLLVREWGRRLSIQMELVGCCALENRQCCPH